MDDELMMQILSMGSDEEAIAELLRQADRQDAIGDATRGNEYLMDAGRMKVANPWGAVSDMFVRGNAEKKAKELRGQTPNMRATMNERLADFVKSSQGKGLGGVDLHAPVSDAAIAGSKPMPMPQAPQVPPPPAPPAPAPAPAPQAAPPPPNPALQAPPGPQGPFAQGPGPSGAKNPGALNAQLMAQLGMGGQGDDVDQILAMLKQQGGGMM